MELVYLWVEEYKNIHKQGFNFSPRFSCDYDEKTNELTIKENNDYIENFFGKNINVTAIVGKNGSGKSSVLEILTNKNIISYLYNEECKRIGIDDFLESVNILLYSEDMDSLSYKNSFNINQIVDTDFKIKNKYIFYNIAISFLFNTKSLNNIIDMPFFPTHLEFNLLKEVSENDFSNLLHQQIWYDNDMLDTRDVFNISSKEIKKLKDFIQKKLNILDTSTDFTYYLYLREFIYKLNNGHNGAFKIAEEIIMDYNLPSFDNFQNKLYHQLYKDDNENIFNQLIDDLNRIHKIRQDENQFILEISNIDIEKLLLNIHRGFFNMYFFNITNKEKVYLKNLSNGEQKFLLFLAKIFYVIRKKYVNNKKPIYILLDEPDIYFHPEWQRVFIDTLVTFLKNITFLENRKINIIITSHSPFIVSDLPKENIIFLKDGKQVKGIEKKQTFGANIHTLVSDSFFMEDGLMGEFAKRKINEIKRFYDVFTKYQDNKKIKKAYKWIYLKKRKNFWHIQSIIGEPFLKTVIKNYLDEIENILFDDTKAKEMAIGRLIQEFDKDDIMRVLNGKT